MASLLYALMAWGLLEGAKTAGKRGETKQFEEGNVAFSVASLLLLQSSLDFPFENSLVFA